MEFKDYYALLEIASTATQDEIKRSYRKLARKYHPDVSKEPDAEERFKAVAEAYETLSDTEKRTAYDRVCQRHQAGADFAPSSDWNSGYEFGEGDSSGETDFTHSDFFEAMFGRHGARRTSPHRAGEDRHARIQIDLRDAFLGARRSIILKMPERDAGGSMKICERHLDVSIPRGICAGQHLKLAGQGEPGQGDGRTGDLYLEVEFAAHPHFRVDGRDLYLDLPVSPWEAALGASVSVPLLEGTVSLSIQPGSGTGRRLRLKGKGIPGSTPGSLAGDLFAVLSITLPPALSTPAQEAYRSLAACFGDFNPRQDLEATNHG